MAASFGKLEKPSIGISDAAKLANCAPATVSCRLNKAEFVSTTIVVAFDAANEQLG